MDYYEEYLISAFSPGLYYSYGINEIEYSESASLYIAQLNKYNRSTIIYSKLDPHTNSSGNRIVLEP